MCCQHSHKQFPALLSLAPAQVTLPCMEELEALLPSSFFGRRILSQLTAKPLVQQHIFFPLGPDSFTSLTAAGPARTALAVSLLLINITPSLYPPEDSQDIPGRGTNPCVV